MFPMTITLNTPAQLNAVLLALQPDLSAGDFKDPTVGAAYVEAKERVANHDAASGWNPEFVAATKAREAQAKAKASAPKPDAATAPTSPTAEAEAAAAPETKVESTSDDADATVTYDDVKKAILDVSKAKGRDAAVKLLADFGAAKGPDLQGKPETFGRFVKAAKELLK